MESYNELCLKWWEGFYSSFQSSCVMTYISEDGTSNVKQGEMSIMLGVWGNETDNIAESASTLGIDVIRLNQILYQIENKCLQKIILMYEQYKSSLHLENKDSNYVVSNVPDSEVPLIDISGTEKYSVTQNFPEKTISSCQEQNNPVVEQCQSKSVEIVDLDIKDEVKNQHPKIVHENINQILNISEIQPKYTVKVEMNCKIHEGVNNSDIVHISDSKNSADCLTKVSVCDQNQSLRTCSIPGRKASEDKKNIDSPSKSNNNDSSLSKGEHSLALNQHHNTKDLSITNNLSSNDSLSTSAQIRRSSRQVKVTSRYANNRDVVRILVKPEKSECPGGENEKETLTSNSSPYIKSKPFFCPVCQDSFSSHKSFINHQCSNADKIETRAIVSNVGDISKYKSSAINKDIANVEVENDFTKMELSYKCDVCARKFKTLRSLEFHCSKHNESKKTYRCSICSKKFHQVNAYVRHLQKIHGNHNCRELDEKVMTLNSNSDSHLEQSEQSETTKTFSCEVYRHNFPDQCTFEDHHAKHEKDGESASNSTIQCSECNKLFKDEVSHSLHCKESSHFCGVCHMRIGSAEALVTHTRIHVKSTHHECDQCFKVFSERRSLDAHKLSHTGEKPFACTICGKTFRRQLGLLNHSSLHDSSKAIQCDICNKLFVDKYGMLKHKTIHTGEKPFSCHVCGKSFRIKKGLSDHVKLHDKNLQYQCELCPRTFVEKRKLNVHLRAHRGEKAFVCEQCGQRFMNSMTLKVHKRRHTGEKPYKCSFCGKTFNQQGSLIAHERNHKGEKPYICDICGEGYVTKSHLTIHKRKHTNTRPYKCDQCNYAAFTRTLLKIHMLKHSSDKPFKCDVCPAAFKRSHHLEVHMRTHKTEEKPIHCEYCDESFDSNKKFSAHLMKHEIVVVNTPHANAVIDGNCFGDQGPGEVAYNIVLLS